MDQLDRRHKTVKLIVTLICVLAAGAVNAGNISEDILALSSLRELTPEHLSLLEKTAASDTPEGMLSAAILFAHDAENYRAIFRERCAYNYQMNRVVVDRRELGRKVEAHIARLGEVSKLEEDFQTYHFLRHTGYVFLREDGSEFQIEKVLSSSSFTRLAMARREKDVPSFVLKMVGESYQAKE